MSHLGDLIIQVGPFADGEELGGFAAALTDTAELNALRDELIELRTFRERMLRSPAGLSNLLDTGETS